MTDRTGDHAGGTINDFDLRAATWDDPAKVERARRVAEAIVAATAPTPTTTVFEYGAGTGLVSEALGARVGPVLLADSSAGMREAMVAKVADGRLRDARIVDLDLAAADVAVPDERFDLVVTVLTLHHVVELETVLGRLRELTASGGHLCVVDLDAEDGSFHGDGFVGHHGFDRDDLAAALRAAGFDRVKIDDCGVLERDGGAYPMFLAVASAA